MASSYSLDLRDRVVAFVDAGHSRRAAGRRFAVSESFSIKLVRRVVETGSSKPGRQGRPKGSGKLEPHAAFLAGIVEAQPDITMPELRDRLLDAQGVEAAPAMLSRFLCRRGFTYKKSADGLGARTR
jgi:transposase